MRAWAHEQLPKLDHVVTLTLKQHMQTSGVAARVNPHGHKSFVKIDEWQAQKACEQFIERLNAEIFRTAARRYGITLFYLPALEWSANRRLHLHIGIGVVPSWARGVKLYQAAGRAAKHTAWLDREKNIVEADAYALNYVTKQVERHNTNAILWQCVPVASKLHQPTVIQLQAF